jgi:hypothetical protein
MDLKRAVFDAHHSAFGRDDRKFEGFRPILEEEVFTLGGARGVVPRWPLHELFDGLEVALTG